MLLQPGERVLIKVPLSELTASTTIKSFNGTTAKVEGVATAHGSLRTYYLEGIEGRCGQKYEFFEDWLVPLNREV